MTVVKRSRGEALIVCTSAFADQPERAAVGSLLNAVRRELPDTDIHDIASNQLMSLEHLPPLRVALPLSLAEGCDITAAVRQARRRDDHLIVAATLGPDWVLAEVVVQRLIEAGARKSDTLVLGVIGSSSPESIEDYSKAARLVSAVWGGPVHIGSLGGTDTSLTDAVDIARAYGERVVVAAYVLTPGRHADMLRHCGADLVTAPLLDGRSPHPRVARLVAERFRQATGSALRVS